MKLARLVRLSIWLAAVLAVACGGEAKNPGAPREPTLRITLAHGTAVEQNAEQALELLVASYDLSKYLFTLEVVIDEDAVSRGYPTLIINPRYGHSPDNLLSRFIHEQIHFHTETEHDSQRDAAVARLKLMYPDAPVGRPEGADTLFSTYGHLMVCYLEIQADRRLIGSDRTAAVIAAKEAYTWVYATVLRDEEKIAAVVDEFGLRIE